jgi:hypothetical protein
LGIARILDPEVTITQRRGELRRANRISLPVARLSVVS